MITLVSSMAFWLCLACVVADDAFIVATLNPATMETLQLFRGDTIIVRYIYLHL